MIGWLLSATLAMAAPAPATGGDAAGIDRAIYSLLRIGAPAFRVQPTPNHPLVRDKTARSAMAQAIVQAAIDHGVPPYLLAAIAYREGAFRHSAVGSRGERTTFQVMRRVAAAVKAGTIAGATTAVPTCALDTVAGSAQCAAGLLQAAYRQCGGASWARAVVRYATGNTCRSGDSELLRFIARDRLALAEELARRAAAGTT